MSSTHHSTASSTVPRSASATLVAARTTRPKPGEHAPYHVTYFAHVPEGDIVAVLSAQLDDALALARSIPSGLHTHRYAPGKWSVTELFGHVVDLERVFGMRAMCFARKDPGPLPSVDEDPYVAAACFDERGLASLVEEFEHLRRANLALYSSFDEAALERRGTASGHVMSVRGMMFLTAGHAAHHFNVLRERYLSGVR
jgi:hypothetical protein